MRSVLFVVNDLRTFKPNQATAQLVGACARHAKVWVTSVTGFAITPDGISVAARKGGPARREDLARMRNMPAIELPLSEVDDVWVRTNPGRDARPSTPWLQLLFQVEDAGVTVRNSPSALVRASSKMYLGSLPPGTIPRTWASEDPERLSDFLDELGGPAVVKPSLGTGGRGVARLSPQASARTEILERAVLTGPALLQEYLPDAPEGDTRVHVVDGEILEVDGRPCAVRRVPSKGEWRSNVSLGAKPARAELTDAQRAVVAEVGPILVEQGLWHVGLDLVGPKIVECNVFSPGGLREAGEFEGVDFVSALVERFLS